MTKYFKGFTVYIVIFLFVVLILWLTNTPDSGLKKIDISYRQMQEKLWANEVEELTISKDNEIGNAGRAKITYNTTDENGKEIKAYSIVEILSMDTFVEWVNNLTQPGSGIDTNVKNSALPKTNLFMQMLPTLIIMVVTVVVLMFILQQVQGGGGGRVMSFGKSKARVNIDDKKKITFDQVASLEEEKAELQEIVEFLKAPKKFIDIGARIPKGVLLVGPPGTGKTYLAKAVSGEAGVPFFSISGSDFVEMFVGVGASRVRDLFDQAKKNSPCIVFIDEIDAVGRRRGAGLGGGHDEREQTLNQLLVEMDGFGVNEGVIVIAATNRADILDPALLRPGRFDRRITVGLPDVKGREAILKVHTRGKLLANDVDLRIVAQTTPGFTPADIENLMNEAALMAARDDKKQIDMAEIRRAFIKVGMGTEKKSHVISDKEKRITAYHEAGHAIIHELLDEIDPTYIISIIPTGWAGGYVMPLPGDDKLTRSKKMMEQEIVAMLGGRAAEQIVLKDITTGASNDIERATATARSMVTKYGMSDKLGPIQFGDDNNEVFIGRDLAHTRNYGENIATIIDGEIKNIIDKAYNHAIEILEKYIEILHQTADMLIEKEKVTGEELRAMFPEGLIPKVKRGFMGEESV